MLILDTLLQQFENIHHFRRTAMTNEQITTMTIKDIVTDNFQTAAVFEKYSLDFCCRGGKTINEACTEKGIAADTVISDLVKIGGTHQSADDKYSSLPLNELVEHIITTHHAYVKQMIPVIYTHTQKVKKVHGENHPEVVEIADHFEIVAADLQQHMHKEEQMLFPYILSLLNAQTTGSVVSPSPFGSVKNPIRMMEQEHQAAGDEMYGIRSLSSGYTPPEDACTTFRVSYQELQEFEKDLHQHVHLENNILFPKAVQLEQTLQFAN
jgi:regulator of cell morphogenesis and NO signaling